ncbi:MAG: 50S ribosomal protein L29 [Deltaproteobacteria bacterium]|jgi:large subunit ribosomal protein L29|nr:50S ribosomal protein L29 [Deltaproteobacteria bacterium]
MSSAITKAKDLRGQTEEELHTFVREKGDELFKLQYQRSTGQLENTARVGQVRREIARAKTILGEKKKA